MEGMCCGTSELSALVERAQNESLVHLPSLAPAVHGLGDDADALGVLLESVCARAGPLDGTPPLGAFEYDGTAVARRRLRQRRAEEAAKDAQRQLERERQAAEKRQQHEERLENIQRDRLRRAEDCRRKERAQRAAFSEERRRKEAAQDEQRARVEQQVMKVHGRLAQDMARRQRELLEVEEEAQRLQGRQLLESARKAAVGRARARQRLAAKASEAQLQGAAADEEPATNSSSPAGGDSPQNAARRRLRQGSETRRRQLQEDREIFGHFSEASRNGPSSTPSNEEGQPEEPRDQAAVVPVRKGKPKNGVALLPMSVVRERRRRSKYRLAVEVVAEEPDDKASATERSSPSSARLHNPFVSLERKLAARRAADERARAARRAHGAVQAHEEAEGEKLEKQAAKRVAAHRRSKLQRPAAKTRQRSATVQARPTSPALACDATTPAEASAVPVLPSL